MKKSLLFVAASATLLFAACTAESGGPSSNISYDVLKAAEQANVPTPITFSTFTGREAVTRIGTIGNVTELRDHGGFGVFAYHTHGDYSPAAMPNFMYNQQVVGSAAATPVWSYSPIKYWPNDTQADAEAAGISANKDKLSFFAYAPYIPMNIIRSADGVVLDAPGGNPKTQGIIQITPKDGSTAGDVKIAYEGGTSKLADELLFGVAEGVAPATVPWTGVDGIATPIPAGMPFKSLVKPADNTTIKFYFKHALTRLKMSVVAAKNQVGPGPAAHAFWVDGADPNKTKILIEKITINRPVHTGGVLNLNNTVAGEPEWEDLAAHASGTFIIDKNHALDDDVLGYDADPAVAFAREGVTTTAKPVFGSHPIDPADPTGPKYDDYYLLIPETATTAPATTSITIEYHVMTQDPNLPGQVSDVKNTITKTIPVQLVLEKAKSYEIRMVLGVNSVDLDVAVENWTDAAGYPQTINLPINND